MDERIHLCVKSMILQVSESLHFFQFVLAGIKDLQDYIILLYKNVYEEALRSPTSSIQDDTEWGATIWKDHILETISTKRLSAQ